MADWARPALTAEQKRDMWSRWKAGQSLSEIGGRCAQPAQAVARDRGCQAARRERRHGWSHAVGR